ncbi:MAG: DUF1320 family protein [Phycisphaeraceae bacterium]|nr:DUF1320 family protein [Phycisphaeraceae bacterium]
MGYCTIDDMNLWFGQANIAQWSSLDGSSSQPDATRLGAAIDTATRRIEDRLRSGPYALPLRQPNAQAPPIAIRDVCMMFAAAWLLESRALAGLDAPSAAAMADRLNAGAARRLDRIVRGHEQLNATLKPIATHAPEIVLD